MVCGISVISDAATLPSHTTIQIRPLIPAPMLPGAARTCPALPLGSSRLPCPAGGSFSTFRCTSNGGPGTTWRNPIEPMEKKAGRMGAKFQSVDHNRRGSRALHCAVEFGAPLQSWNESFRFILLRTWLKACHPSTSLWIGASRERKVCVMATSMVIRCGEFRLKVVIKSLLRNYS